MGLRRHLRDWWHFHIADPLADIYTRIDEHQQDDGYCEQKRDRSE